MAGLGVSFVMGARIQSSMEQSSMQKIIRTDDHQIWRAIRCHEKRQSSDLMDFAADGLP